MARPKITVVGAGNVGASVAQYAVENELGDVVLVDVVEGIPQGKALDLAQAGPVHGYDSTLDRQPTATTTPANSDVVVITAGLARKPGMTRDDLLFKNAEIVGGVVEQIVARSPQRDPDPRHQPARRHGAARVARSPASRTSASSAWPACSTRRASGPSSRASSTCPVENVTAFVLGGHGDTMVPLPRYSTVAGIPITELLAAGEDRGARDPHRQRRRRDRQPPQDGQRLLRAGRLGGRDGRGDPQGQEEDPAVRGVPRRAVRRQRASTSACR